MERGRKLIIWSSVLVTGATGEVLICSSGWVGHGLILHAGASLVLELHYHSLIHVIPEAPISWWSNKHFHSVSFQALWFCSTMDVFTMWILNLEYAGGPLSVLSKLTMSSTSLMCLP